MCEFREPLSLVEGLFRQADLAANHSTAPEGFEVKDSLHFDAQLRPLNALARQMVAALPTSMEDDKDLSALEGRLGRFQLGEPNRHTGYQPVTEWQPIEHAVFTADDLMTGSPYEFRRDGKQFRVRFDTGQRVEEGSIAVNGATLKIQAILRASPDAISYDELYEKTHRTSARRNARWAQDETGMGRSQGATDPVFDAAAAAACLDEVRRLGDEIDEAYSIPSALLAQEAEERRTKVLEYLASGIGRKYSRLIKDLRKSCCEHDRKKEAEIRGRLASKMVKGRPARSDAEKLRDRVRNSVAHGIKMVCDGGLCGLAAHFKQHLVAANCSYSYTDASRVRAWRL